ncbi:hypothetical protein B0H10DRAFT_1290098 [Mycena sp. CBHHK59/15]|nr:hypothetical protein B0H10DRAFT_1290098 [Mycena sp. CBHHK59/15]
MSSHKSELRIIVVEDLDWPTLEEGTILTSNSLWPQDVTDGGDVRAPGTPRAAFQPSSHGPMPPPPATPWLFLLLPFFRPLGCPLAARPPLKNTNVACGATMPPNHASSPVQARPRPPCTNCIPAPCTTPGAASPRTSLAPACACAISASRAGATAHVGWPSTASPRSRLCTPSLLRRRPHLSPHLCRTATACTSIRRTSYASSPHAGATPSCRCSRAPAHGCPYRQAWRRRPRGGA